MRNKAVTIIIIPLILFLLYASPILPMKTKDPKLIVQIKSGKKIAYYENNITKEKISDEMTKILVCNSLFMYMNKNKEIGRFVPPKYTLVILKNFTEKEYEVTDKHGYIVKGEPYK